MTTAEQLAAIAEQLDHLDHLGADTPTRDAIADALRGRTWTLPRGVTFTTRDDEGVIYCEHKTRRGWNDPADVRDRVEVTVYGTVTRANGETRGSVDIAHYFNTETADPTRAFWRGMTGLHVPDGARAAVVDAVRGAVAGMLTEQGWTALADEVEHAKKLANIRGDLGTAVRAIEDARAKLARLA